MHKTPIISGIIYKESERERVSIDTFGAIAIDTYGAIAIDTFGAIQLIYMERLIDNFISINLERLIDIKVAINRYKSSDSIDTFISI